MDCFLLGSGGMMPMPERRLSALLVRYQGCMILFDAGEGVQIGLKALNLGLRGLDVVAITHLHADHVLGLPGVMMLRTQMPDPAPLTLIGPPGLQDFVQDLHRSVRFFLNYPLHFVELDEGADPVAWRDEDLVLRWTPLEHSTFCLGYRLDEQPRPGRFDLARAQALGVPRGPLFSQLQRGLPVTLDDGTWVQPEQVLGPARRGRSVVYAVDTRPCQTLRTLCQQADLAVLDGMFTPDEVEHARDKRHMTMSEAAELAQQAGVRHTLLTHLSPRHRADEVATLERSLRERFANVRIGRDGDSVELAPLDDPA
ncbi:MAG: ribonuclease Z [Pseudomonadota bacterium]